MLALAEQEVPAGLAALVIASVPVWIVALLVGPGSLLAYSAFVWLLANAPVSLASTYAYVNPLVVVLLGWALLSEAVTGTIVAGALAILASVAVIVRSGGRAQNLPRRMSPMNGRSSPSVPP